MDSSPDLLKQKLQAWGPGTHIFNKPALALSVHSGSENLGPLALYFSILINLHLRRVQQKKSFQLSPQLPKLLRASTGFYVYAWKIGRF